jgi:alpha-ketoglutarate-dependent taurine dioxygenase
MSIEISPLSDSLGLKINNINLKESLSSEAIQNIHNAWLEGGVICIPGQDLDEGDQVKFGQLFGELATTQGEYQISKSHHYIMYVTIE